MGATYTSVLSKPRPSRREAVGKDERIIIVGNGMVGCKLCESLIQAGVHRTARILVVGAERIPAYDRIRLSSYVDHQDPARLILHEAAWYEDHNITLRSGDPVVKIDRPRGKVELKSGARFAYDRLVLATGSRAFMPPIEGITHPNVFPYRSLNDLDDLIAAASGKTKLVVLGGGLLGLEAAQAAQKLGLNTSIVEQAAFLMPRQLNRRAATRLEQIVNTLDIDVHTGDTVQRVENRLDSLVLKFADRAPLETDLVIVAAGITPNCELAKTAGLAVGLRGGVIVNEQLETSDPNIFAIGECALLNGQIYGLAAPGFAMARHLVKRLLGCKTEAFPRPDLSTRLKMMGVEVTTIGDPLEEGRRIEYEDSDCYRMLILEPRGALRGGLGVGPWPESGRIQALYSSSANTREKEEHNFVRKGALAPQSAEIAIARWPGTRVVCNCMHVTKGELTLCLTSHGRDPELLAKATGASTVCGSCRPLLNELCGSVEERAKPVGVRSLLAISGLALLLAATTFLGPNPPVPDSVESWWYGVDRIWTDGQIKQITGFTLLGLSLAGLLLSLRKRFKWFRFGHFARWRVLHTALGLTALVGLFVHTGFRFGHNLNFWLMFSFVGLSILGGCAGVVSALESSGSSRRALAARRFRPILSYAHLVLFWPLPVLVTFHILSVYFY